MAAVDYKVGDPVIHRAWGTKGTIVKVPKKMHWLARVDVAWQDGKTESAWIPSIKADFEEMIFDWSDDDGQEETGGDGALLDTDEW